jgi:hypothetical protein
VEPPEVEEVEPPELLEVVVEPDDVWVHDPEEPVMVRSPELDPPELFEDDVGLGEGDDGEAAAQSASVLSLSTPTCSLQS